MKIKGASVDELLICNGLIADLERGNKSIYHGFWCLFINYGMYFNILFQTSLHLTELRNNCNTHMMAFLNCLYPLKSETINS